MFMNDNIMLVNSKSIEYFDKEIGQLVDEIEHCGWRVYGLLKEGKESESRKFNDKITELEPKLFQFREQKAQALEKLGKQDEALQLREKNEKKELY